MKTEHGYVLYSIPPQNMIPICLLETLRMHSDINCRLTQKKIQEYLEKDFSITTHRTTIKPNLMNLIDFGYDIQYRKISRGNSAMYTDWYIEKDFSNEELAMIYSSINKNNNVPDDIKKNLLRKIKILMGNPANHFLPK